MRQPRAPPPSGAGLAGRGGAGRGGEGAAPAGSPVGPRLSPRPAPRPRPPAPCPLPAAPWKAWHRARAPHCGRVRAAQACVKGWTPLSASRQRPRRAPGTAGNGLEDGAAGGVSTPDSLRPPGSRLLVPPRGPKTAGATAPVAAAARSWRARAAVAAAADSCTRTAGCLGLPRRERWAPARPPSHPPRREPQQLRRPGPIRPDPRSQDRGTRCLLRRKIRPDLRLPSPSPQFPDARRCCCAGAKTPQSNVRVSGGVHSVQLCPMGANIRCGGRDLAERGVVPVSRESGAAKVGRLCTEAELSAKPVRLLEVCTIFGPSLICV